MKFSRMEMKIENGKCCGAMKGIRNSRAFALALRVLHIPVARTLVLVSVSPRWHTVALLAADSTVLQASLLKLSLRTSPFTL